MHSSRSRQFCMVRYICRNLSWLISGFGWLELCVAAAIVSLTFVAMNLVILDSDSVAQWLAGIFFAVRAPNDFYGGFVCGGFPRRCAIACEKEGPRCTEPCEFSGLQPVCTIPVAIWFRRPMTIDSENILQRNPHSPSQL